MLHADKNITVKSITSEVLPAADKVVVKSTVVIIKAGETKKDQIEQTFTGLSAANPAKLIEKASPYEVAESSALGRALGFAGYGIDEGIASADEIHKAQSEDEVFNTDDQFLNELEQEKENLCSEHGVKMVMSKKGGLYHMERNSAGETRFCNGKGFGKWLAPL